MLCSLVELSKVVVVHIQAEESAGCNLGYVVEIQPLVMTVEQVSVEVADTLAWERSMSVHRYCCRTANSCMRRLGCRPHSDRRSRNRTGRSSHLFQLVS